MDPIEDTVTLLALLAAVFLGHGHDPGTRTGLAVALYWAGFVAGLGLASAAGIGLAALGTQALSARAPGLLGVAVACAGALMMAGLW